MTDQTPKATVALELSCNTQLACLQCGRQDFRICMEADEVTDEISKTLVNNVECSACHALYQVNLVVPARP
jgi:transcription elongation factor Elf1